jgi:hypothetical protein
MDLGEIGWGDVDCIHLAQDRDQWQALVNMAMSFHVPLDVGKYVSSWKSGGFSRTTQFHGVS